MKKIILYSLLVTFFSFNSFSQDAYSGFRLQWGAKFSHNRMPIAYWDTHNSGSHIGKRYSDKYNVLNHSFGFSGKSDEMYIESNVIAIELLVAGLSSFGYDSYKYYTTKGPLKNIEENIGGEDYGRNFQLIDFDMAVGGEYFVFGFHAGMGHRGTTVAGFKTAYQQLGLSAFYFIDNFKIHTRFGDHYAGAHSSYFYQGVTYVYNEFLFATVFFHSSSAIVRKHEERYGQRSDAEEIVSKMIVNTLGIKIGLFI